VQKVQRYSFMRPFSEVYRLSSHFDDWRRRPEAAVPEAETAIQPPKHLLRRRVPYPEFARLEPVKHVAVGRMEPVAKIEKPWQDRLFMNIGPMLKGFRDDQILDIPSREAQYLRSVQTAVIDQAYRAGDAFSLKENDYRILDFGADRTGMLGARVTCRKDTRLWFVFDEILSGTDVDFKRMECVNIVSYRLAPGVYDLEAIEPYTLRYLKLVCLEG